MTPVPPRDPVPDRTRAQRAETRAVVAFGASALGAIGLAVVYWSGGQPQLEGLLLFVALGGIGYGLVTWANHLLPGGAVVGEREPLASEGAERAELEEDIEDAGDVLGRRRALGRMLVVAVGALAAALVFPVRSLGPRPRRSLLETPWHDGLRLVTSDGTAVRAEGVPLDGLVTVYPEGFAGSADGQAVLVRVRAERLRPRPGREDWSPEGLVAYSKLCTHAGCPVGLYSAQSHELLCPCHQSAFDVLDGARPVFGPAAAPLPQLPLRIVDGEIVATGDFSEPVGPSFWRRA